MSITVSIIGGDLRQIALASALEDAGYTVRLAGIDGKRPEVRALTGLLREPPDADPAAFSRDCRICILPLPVTGDGEHVFAPLAGEGTMPLAVGALASALPENTVFFGGNVSDFTHRLFAEHRQKITDYYGDEQFQVRNAVPTAEGAVAIAMQELQTTVAGSRCCVIGFGRVGKALGMTLCRLGAEVTVAARSITDRGWAKAFGCEAVPLDEYLASPCRCDIVYNTVPVMLLSGEVLRRFTRRPILVELASHPGIDEDAAKSLGFRYVRANGLPGKVAPVTAGRIIAETILERLPREVIL